MTDNIPKICAAFEIWQDHDCIRAGTTLELIMRYLADDPEIDHQVTDIDRDTVVRDYIIKQNENLNAKTLIIRELNNQIKQLKNEYSINDDCVGCCKVVDVTAKLQKELDECSNMNLSLLEERYEAVEVIRSKDRVIYTLNKIVEGLRACAVTRSDYEIMRTNHLNTVAKLKDDIEDLNSQLTDERAIIDKITSPRVDEVEALYCLEAELSARKEDYKVLMKVVDSVKNWDECAGLAYSTLYRIADALVDYLDAPEGPETSIDDLYRVSVFLEMP